jgi:hypothetical protein
MAEVRAKVLADLKPANLTLDHLSAAAGVGELKALLLILACVGTFVSGFVYVSVVAARIAIASIEAKWLKEIKSTMCGP